MRNFLDDPRRSGLFAESDRREGSRRHTRNWGGADFDKVKTGMEQGRAWPPRVGAGKKVCRWGWGVGRASAPCSVNSQLHHCSSELYALPPCAMGGGRASFGNSHRGPSRVLSQSERCVAVLGPCLPLRDSPGVPG